MRSWYRGLRRLAQWAWVEFLMGSGCLWWAKRRLRARGEISVLAFHRVLDDEGCRRTASLPGMVVRRKTFEALAKHVAKHFNVVDVTTVRPGGRPSKPQLAFTFDDGWKDNLDTMLPIAEEHRIPTTVFVCSGVCGEVAPFWPERFAIRLREGGRNASWEEVEAAVEALKCGKAEARDTVLEASGMSAQERLEEDYRLSQDRTLSWADIRRMSAAGISFGAHTRRHRMLADDLQATAMEEIAGSKSDLERELKLPCEAFAYPNGQTTPEVRRLVREAGFMRAFTTQLGVWTAGLDPLEIPRSCVWEGCFTAPWGAFSPAMATYTMIWRPWRASAARRRSRRVTNELAALPI